MVDGPNRYAYVRNNPVALTDAWGLQASDKQCQMEAGSRYERCIEGANFQFVIAVQQCSVMRWQCQRVLGSLICGFVTSPCVEKAEIVRDDRKADCLSTLLSDLRRCNGQEPYPIPPALPWPPGSPAPFPPNPTPPPPALERICT
jgi:hypothetical protein